MNRLIFQTDITPGREQDLHKWCEENNAQCERIIRSIDAGDHIYKVECPDKDTFLLAKLTWGQSSQFRQLLQALKCEPKTK